MLGCSGGVEAVDIGGYFLGRFGADVVLHQESVPIKLAQAS